MRRQQRRCGGSRLRNAMPRMTGQQALVEMLRAEGVKYVFGNPGTTELPFLDALQDAPDIQYVTSLFEGVAAGMADGYARITQRPSFMNFHISVGVSNSIAVMYNSWRGGTPMVITAGQTAASLQLHNPTLYSNMVNVMREYTKWSGEVTTPEDVPSIVRRAFKVAATPPTGPVFVSFAWDSMNREAEMDVAPSVDHYFRVLPDARAVERASGLLANSKRPLMLVGDRVSQSPGAPALVAQLAEQLGAPVFATSFSEVHLPSSHPHYLGTFDTSWLHREMKERFDAADLILAVGTEVMVQSIPTPEPPFSGPPKLVHVDCSDWDIQRSYPVAAGVLGDIAGSLEQLSTALSERMTSSEIESARGRRRAVEAEKLRRRESFDALVNWRWDETPMSPERFAVELRRALPPDVLVCDDSITVRSALMGAMNFDEPGTLVGGRGGSLGFGMGATLGMKLAAPNRPVVGVIGDGTAMFTIQAFWTAVRYRIPVVWVICNNGSYKVLRENMARYLTGRERDSKYIGMDFYDNPLDFAAMAESFGVRGVRVERPEELGPAIQEGLNSGEPMLIDAILNDDFDPDAIQGAWGRWWEGR